MLTLTFNVLGGSFESNYREEPDFEISQEFLQDRIILNYVWINDEPFDAHKKADMCGVPLHYIERAAENAKRYPEAEVNIWLDYNFLDDPSRYFVGSVAYLSGAKNIKIRDLNEIPAYRDNPNFQPEENKPIWLRVDLARLLVVQHEMELQPERPVFYADFDIPDVKICDKRVAASLKKTGFVAGGFLSGADEMENGYFGTINTPAVRELFVGILDRGAFILNNPDSYCMDLRDRLWRAHIERVKVFMAAHNSLYSRCLIPVQPGLGYKIPRNPLYSECGLYS